MVFNAEVGFREFVALMLVRSVLLGVLEAKRPELCPGFFEVDLAPFILRFIKYLFCNGSECCGELTKGSDYILCAVFLWLTSVLPLLWAVDQKRQVAEYAASSEFMLGVSMAIFLFCLHGLRVVLLCKGFDGELSYCRSNGRGMLISCQRQALSWALCYLLLSSLALWCPSISSIW